MKRVKLISLITCFILLIFPRFLWAQNWSWGSWFGDSSPKKQREVFEFKGEEYDYNCGKGTGLASTYYTDTRLRFLSKVQYPEPVIDFYLMKEDPAPGIDGETFSIRWEGFIYAPESGVYTFSAVADDGMRIWLEDELVLDAWIEQVPTTYEFRARFEAGKLYKIQVDYVQLMYDHAVAKLFWKIPSEYRRKIIQEQFFFPQQPQPCKEEPKEEMMLTASVEPQIPSSPPVIEKKESKKPKSKPEIVLEQVTPSEETKKTTAIASETAYDELLSKKKIVLDDITFHQGSFQFKEDQATQESLQKLLNTLKKYDAIKVEISGHTDNVGRYYANQRLSQNRADKVKFFLIDNGITEDRIITKGYGSDVPVETNHTPDGRGKNRRVEIKVVE